MHRAYPLPRRQNQVFFGGGAFDVDLIEGTCSPRNACRAWRGYAAHPFGAWAKRCAFRPHCATFPTLFHALLLLSKRMAHAAPGYHAFELGDRYLEVLTKCRSGRARKQGHRSEHVTNTSRRSGQPPLSRGILPTPPRGDKSCPLQTDETHNHARYAYAPC